MAKTSIWEVSLALALVPAAENEAAALKCNSHPKLCEVLQHESPSRQFAKATAGTIALSIGLTERFHRR